MAPRLTFVRLAGITSSHFLPALVLLPACSLFESKKPPPSWKADEVATIERWKSAMSRDCFHDDAEKVLDAYANAVAASHSESAPQPRLIDAEPEVATSYNPLRSKKLWGDTIWRARFFTVNQSASHTYAKILSAGGMDAKELLLGNQAIQDLTPLLASDVTSLDLRGNTQLRDLTVLGCMSYLEKVRLANTAVDRLASLGTCPKLKILEAHGLTVDLVGLEKCTSLEELDLSGAKLSTEQLGSLTSLRRLRLRNCDLNTLEFLVKLDSVEEVDLRNPNAGNQEAHSDNVLRKLGAVSWANRRSVINTKLLVSDEDVSPERLPQVKTVIGKLRAQEFLEFHFKNVVVYGNGTHGPAPASRPGFTDAGSQGPARR